MLAVVALIVGQVTADTCPMVAGNWYGASSYRMGAGRDENTYYRYVS